MGSTLLAREAGAHAATTATPASTSVTSPMVSGSDARTSKSRLEQASCDEQDRDSERQAHCRQLKYLAEDEPQHVAALRAERQPHAHMLARTIGQAI